VRSLPLLMIPLLASCSWVEREREEAALTARAATFAEVEAMLSEAIGLADGTAGEADRILSPLPVMTPLEEAGLRRFLGGAHVATASDVGVRVASRETLDSLLAAGRLVELADSTGHWIVRDRASPAYVVPAMPVLLEIIGERFQQRLAAMELPPYRMEVTSALRTSERQARLRRSNANAAADVSSHEFGATVDLSYAAFAPPAEAPDMIPPAAPAQFRPHLERIVDLALESVSARKSRELGKIFSAVLKEVQDEGLALVIYERQQTIYHLTVARRLPLVAAEG